MSPAPVEETLDPLTVVEHLTVPAFICRAPRRFHLDEITRFGDKVGKMADSLHISFHTKIDPTFGMIRLFPVPLMTRVYQVMAAQYGWPLILEQSTLEGRQHEMARANERARKHLETAVEHAQDPEVAEAAAKVFAWLEKETARLHQADGAPETPPLKVI